MSAARANAELFTGGVRAVRRAAMWWGIGISFFSLLNIAFWPMLESSDALSELDEVPEGMLEAFGAQNLATPAGYLDGQLYALMLPLLLSGLAIAVVTAITSGDEHAGRLELVHASPVSRRAVWLLRLASSLVAVLAVAMVTSVAIGVAVRVFSLDGVTVLRVCSVTLACGLLAAFHAAVAYAVGAFGASRGASVGAGVLALLGGYVLDFLVPLVRGGGAARNASPWYWAIGQQPSPRSCALRCCSW